MTAPIHVLGWDDDNHFWGVSRDGEPSFHGVQDLEDLYAAALTRECAMVMSDEVWSAMNGGFTPIRPSDVRRP